jgi:hypothetical protein
MKTRWIVVMGLIAVTILAATPLTLPRNKAGRVQYLDATEVPGATPDQLMERARSWLAQRAHTGEDVAVGEQPHCIMVGDSFQVPHPGMPFTVFYTLAFEAQGHTLCTTVGALTVFDGTGHRPLEYYLNADGSPRIDPWLAESVDRQARALLEDLHKTMAAATPPSPPK